MDKLLSDPYEHLFHFRRLYVNPVKYSSFSELLCSDLSVHLSSNFRELCLCISDDVYEWNHGLFVFLCWLRSYSELDSLCSPLELSCSDLLLSLDCLRDEGISSLRVSFSRLLFSMSTLVFRVNDLSLLDRYDLLVRVSSDKYRASTDLLMTFACYTSYFVGRLLAYSMISPYISRPSGSEFDCSRLSSWFLKQDTYFTISRFRVRIQKILWYLLDDSVNRNLYSYISAGEVCSRYSNLLRVKSSSWMTRLTEDITYLSASELFSYRNSVVSEASILAVLEAHFQSQYSVDVLHKYFCFEDNLHVKFSDVFCSLSPVLVRVIDVWYVCFDRSFVRTSTLFEALYLWFLKLDGKLLDTVDISSTTTQIVGESVDSCCSSLVEVY